MCKDDDQSEQHADASKQMQMGSVAKAGGVTKYVHPQGLWSGGSQLYGDMDDCAEQEDVVWQTNVVC